MVEPLDRLTSVYDRDVLQLGRILAFLFANHAAVECAHADATRIALMRSKS